MATQVLHIICPGLHPGEDTLVSPHSVDTTSGITKRVWSNNKLSDHTKVNVYKVCVISTLLYGSESWAMRAHQEKRSNVFDMRCLRYIPGITWQDKVTNKVVLEKAGILSLYTLLKQGACDG